MRVSRCRARGRGVSSACVFRRRAEAAVDVTADAKTRDAPRRTGARRACSSAHASPPAVLRGHAAMGGVHLLRSETPRARRVVPRRPAGRARGRRRWRRRWRRGRRAPGDGGALSGGGRGVGVEGVRPRRAREEVGAIAAGGPHARGMATAMTGATFARGGAVAVAAEEVAATSVTSAGRRDTGRTTVRTRDDERVWRERVTGRYGTSRRANRRVRCVSTRGSPRGVASGRTRVCTAVQFSSSAICDVVVGNISRDRGPGRPRGAHADARADTHRPTPSNARPIRRLDFDIPASSSRRTTMVTTRRQSGVAPSPTRKAVAAAAAKKTAKKVHYEFMGPRARCPSSSVFPRVLRPRALL